VIRNRTDLEAYLEADRVALGCERSLRALLFDDVWRYQRSLRRLEYRLNTRGNPLALLAAKVQHRRLGRLLGFTIAPNVFGPGLSIAHPGTIVVHSEARVGANCRIHVGVVIGASHDEHHGVPTIGDDCYIGPGAKLFGAVQIGDGTTIGANAVVNRSFPEGNTTIAGVPAKQVASRAPEVLAG
jgi:serine O-acetyltransferase